MPAKAGKHPGYVIKQEPRNGFLSANATVRLYVTRPDPRYGLLPEPRRLERQGRPRRGCGGSRRRRRSRYDKGPAGSVLEQTPEPGVAAGKGLKVALIVGRGTRQREPLTT